MPTTDLHPRMLRGSRSSHDSADNVRGLQGKIELCDHPLKTCDPQESLKPMEAMAANTSSVVCSGPPVTGEEPRVILEARQGSLGM